MNPLPIINKPPCPKCGADNSQLTYVHDVVEYGRVLLVSNSSTCIGDVNESGNCKFHHISCCVCDTFWESEDEFIEACKTALQGAIDGIHRNEMKSWDKVYDTIITNILDKEQI